MNSLQILLPLAGLSLLASLQAGCSGGGEEKESEAAKEKPRAPWDWEPEDPDLAQGREVYLGTCSLCHDEGEESAPRLTNAEAWVEREAKGQEELIRHAVEGFFGDLGEMPERGGNDDLSDEQVAAAVRFMIAAPK